MSQRRRQLLLQPTVTIGKITITNLYDALYVYMSYLLLDRPGQTTINARECRKALGEAGDDDEGTEEEREEGSSAEEGEGTGAAAADELKQRLAKFIGQEHGEEETEPGADHFETFLNSWNPEKVAYSHIRDGKGALQPVLVLPPDFTQPNRDYSLADFNCDNSSDYHPRNSLRGYHALILNLTKVKFNKRAKSNPRAAATLEFVGINALVQSEPVPGANPLIYQLFNKLLIAEPKILTKLDIWTSDLYPALLRDPPTFGEELNPAEELQNLALPKIGLEELMNDTFIVCLFNGQLPVREDYLLPMNSEPFGPYIWPAYCQPLIDMIYEIKCNALPPKSQRAVDRSELGPARLRELRTLMLNVDLDHEKIIRDPNYVRMRANFDVRNLANILWTIDPESGIPEIGIRFDPTSSYVTDVGFRQVAATIANSLTPPGLDRRCYVIPGPGSGGKVKIQPLNDLHSFLHESIAPVFIPRKRTDGGASLNRLTFQKLYRSIYALLPDDIQAEIVSSAPVVAAPTRPVARPAPPREKAPPPPPLPPPEEEAAAPPPAKRSKPDEPEIITLLTPSPPPSEVTEMDEPPAVAEEEEEEQYRLWDKALEDIRAIDEEIKAAGLVVAAARETAKGTTDAEAKRAADLTELQTRQLIKTALGRKAEIAQRVNPDAPTADIVNALDRAIGLLAARKAESDAAQAFYGVSDELKQTIERAKGAAEAWEIAEDAEMELPGAQEFRAKLRAEARLKAFREAANAAGQSWTDAGDAWTNANTATSAWETTVATAAYQKRRAADPTRAAQDTTAADLSRATRESTKALQKTQAAQIAWKKADDRVVDLQRREIDAHAAWIEAAETLYVRAKLTTEAFERVVTPIDTPASRVAAERLEAAKRGAKSAKTNLQTVNTMVEATIDESSKYNQSVVKIRSKPIELLVPPPEDEETSSEEEARAPPKAATGAAKRRRPRPKAAATGAGAPTPPPEPTVFRMSPFSSSEEEESSSDADRPPRRRTPKEVDLGAQKLARNVAIQAQIAVLPEMVSPATTIEQTLEIYATIFGPELAKLGEIDQDRIKLHFEPINEKSTDGGIIWWYPTSRETDGRWPAVKMPPSTRKDLENYERVAFVRNVNSFADWYKNPAAAVPNITAISWYSAGSVEMFEPLFPRDTASRIAAALENLSTRTKRRMFLDAIRLAIGLWFRLRDRVVAAPPPPPPDEPGFSLLTAEEEAY